MGSKPRRGAGQIAGQPAALPSANGRGHRLRRGRGPPPRGAGGGAGAGADLADGQAALRKPRRTRADPGLRVLFPDALPLRLGEPQRERHGWSGGRLHARAGRCARSRGRHRCDSLLAHRRLRAWPGHEAARPGLARPDGQRAQPAPLCGLRRYPADGRALGLRPARLFAAAAGRNRHGDDTGLPYAAAAGGVWNGAGPMGWGADLGADDGGLLSDRALLQANSALGTGTACHRLLLYAIHARTRRCSTGGAGAGFGKGVRRRARAEAS